MAQDKPLLLMVGSAGADFRAYIFESVSRRYRLWLLNATPPTWETPFIESSTLVDCAQRDKLAAAAHDVALEHEVAGVFCYDERFVESAALVSVELGFKTWDPDAVARCRDKSATRAALRDAGLPQPLSTAVSTLPEALSVAAAIGYPVVVKPRNLAGSVGVRKASNADELAAAYVLTAGASLPGVERFERHVIVEEFLDGPEIAVDCLFYDGRCQPIVVAHKLLGGRPPFEFDEQGHDVDASDPLLSDPALLDVLTRSHAAVGFRYGVTHTELKVTPRGFCVVEINPRMGGDLIPHLGHLASGYDESLAAADVAAGVMPAPVTRVRTGAASIRFAVPEHDMEVTSCRVRRELVTGPVRTAHLAVRTGRVLRLPPKEIARLGCVIAVAETAAEARAAVADPGRFFDVTGVPL